MPTITTTAQDVNTSKLTYSMFLQNNGPSTVTLVCGGVTSTLTAGSQANISPYSVPLMASTASGTADLVVQPRTWHSELRMYGG